jgi:predicted enzyme related to lactoylglutathione lyase
VPSHWTPYVRVDDVDAVVHRAVALGGEVIVRPFVIEGAARIALILDDVGAQVGLWEPIGSSRDEKTNG